MMLTTQNPKTTNQFKWNTVNKMLQVCPEVLCIVNKEGKFTQVSSAAEALWLYPIEELTRFSLYDLIEPAEKPAMKRMMKEALSGKLIKDFSSSCINKVGNQVPISWSVKWDQEEQIFCLVAKDASAQVAVNKQLEELKARFSLSQQLAKVGSWEIDFLNYTFWSSDEVYAIAGITREEYPEVTAGVLLTLVHPEDKAEVKKRMLDLEYLFLINHEHRLIRPDGKVIYVHHKGEISRDDQGNIVKIAGVVQDVTERKEAELKLANSEKRFRSLVQNGSDIIGVIDLAGNYLYASDNTKAILGYDAVSFIGKNAFDFIHPDDQEKVFSSLKMIAMEKYVEVKPFRFKNASGQWRWIETKVANQLNDPAINGLIINSRDITEKKHFQDKMRRLSLIAEETVNSVVITDKEGQITWVNKAFTRISGYTFDEAKGRTPESFLHGPETNRDAVLHMQECMREVKPFDVEVINYSKKGEKYWVHIQCQPLFDEEGRLERFFAMQTDITEGKKLQEELNKEIEQRQKRITAEVIKAQEKERSQISLELHDNVNQILTSIKLYNELSLDANANREALIKRSIDYLATCIDEIRSISKRLSTPTLGKISLKDSLKELVNSFNLPSATAVKFSTYGIDTHKVEEDLHLAVYRVAQEHLNNVVRHAKATEVQITVAAISSKLSVIIYDNGKGFGEEKLKSAGITNMISRAEALNGKVEINTAPGKGCTLMVTFPLSEQ